MKYVQKIAVIASLVITSSVSAQEVSGSAALKQVENYFGRNKTLLEQVANYTSYGNEEALKGNKEFRTANFWLETEKCSVTQYVFTVPFNELPKQAYEPDSLPINLHRLVKIKTFDFNNINWKGVEIKNGRERDPYDSKTFQDTWRVGDESNYISASGVRAKDRLRKAWDLAAKECPGKKSSF